jgi:exodeoxyribonuclease III
MCAMKIVSYNVNGIRSALSKGLDQWLRHEMPADIICLQEVKAEEHQIDTSIFKDLGYEVYWMPAVKKGYSGVAILTKQTPKQVAYGCGISTYDDEGRIIRADFEDFSVMSVYMPSGSSGEDRQAFKMKWLDDFYGYSQDLRKEIPRLVVSGDYNICHKPIDIHNPVSNKNSSGFLPEEREWVSKFIDSGFVDTFREVNSQPHQYSWWSYRFNSRQKNLGWRIDYHMVTENLKNRIQHAAIFPDVVHSDHCPIVLDLE